MKKVWLAYGFVCVAALVVVSCSDKKQVGAGNCLADVNACCALATQMGTDRPEEGVDGCEGSDIDTEGEWCDKAAELAKNLLDADQVEGSCAIGLKPNTVTRVPVLWVNSTNENKVAKFDSVSGEELLRVNTWGTLANRTAVANDGSVWITNRNSYHYIHIGVDGEPVCASPYGPRVLNAETMEYEGTGYTRSAAVAADGTVWIGFNDTPYAAVQVSSTEVEDDMVMLINPNDAAEMLEVPRCKELKRVTLTNTAPYGMAADGAGNIWVGTLSGPWVAKIAADGTATEINLTMDPKYPMAAPEGLASCVALYGMTMDVDGNPWFANTTCGNIFSVNKDSNEIEFIGRSPTDPADLGEGVSALSYARSAGIDKNGHIWVADNSYPFAHEFTKEGEWVKATQALCPDTDGDEGPDVGGPGSGLLGIGSDIDGNMWVSMQNTGRAAKFTTEGEVLGCYPEPVYNEGVQDTTKLLQSPYTYSDLTGSSNAIVASQLGRWRGIVEQDVAVNWTAVGFEGNIPEGTSVCVRVRAADTEAALEAESFSSDVCVTTEDKIGPFFVASLIGADEQSIVAKTKFLELELKLASMDEAKTPQVWNLSVAAFK